MPLLPRGEAADEKADRGLAKPACVGLAPGPKPIAPPLAICTCCWSSVISASLSANARLLSSAKVASNPWLDVLPSRVRAAPAPALARATAETALPSPRPTLIISGSGSVRRCDGDVTFFSNFSMSVPMTNLSEQLRQFPVHTHAHAMNRLALKLGQAGVFRPSHSMQRQFLHLFSKHP